MNTIDHLLIELYNIGVEKLDTSVPVRDKKILSSLARQIISGHFLTENQSKLLVKILKENYNSVQLAYGSEVPSLEEPTWSSPFRVIEQLRKIFISRDVEKHILIEFTYNKKLRQVVTELNKVIDGQMISVNSKQYAIPLTEKNIYNVIKTFKPYKFDVDQNLLVFFEEISEIIKKQENVFDVFNLKNEKLIHAIISDIGDISEDNLLLLNDRRFKYQYQVFPKIHEKSLSVAIAQRTAPRIWIDSNVTPFDEVIQSLIVLKRFPLLFVFDGHNSKESIENLKKIANSLEKNNIAEGTGIYFRFDNSSPNDKEFNSLIAGLGYNTMLTKDTRVVGISNNKLPKFMINSPWRPNSVISFSNNFKNNKTSIFCDDVDLTIYYNERKPFGDIDAIV